LWRLWLELGGTRPAVVAGHSLGEYSALVAAGVMTLTDAVRLVRERGRLMQVAVPAGEGAMAAILGLDDATVIAQCAHVSALTQHCVDAANFNAEGQVVIAGHADTVRQAIVALKSVGGKAIMLPVSVPSHCRLMQPAADQLSALLADLTLHEPDMPVIQNARARLETHPAAIRQALIDQLCQPVRWTQSMQRIVEMGMTQVVECGAGNVLSNLAKRMSTPLDAYAIDTRIRFEQALSAVSLAEGNLA
jgi:[acyl-carrier-protein] S-malonyltransferase